MNIIAVSRLTLLFNKKYYEIVSDFFLKIHLFHYKDQSDYAMKTHLLIHKRSHFIVMFVYTAMWSGNVMFHVPPLYKNYKSGMLFNPSDENGTFEHALYWTLPFDYTTNYKGIIFVALFNMYICYICSTLVGVLDVLLCIMVFHLWGHLKIFIHNLEEFPKPKHMINSLVGEWYTEEENRNVKTKLKSIIAYHNILIKFVARMSKVFGGILFVYYGFHQVCGCLLLLECSQLEMSAFMLYGPLTVTLNVLLIQLSTIFDLLESTTMKITTAIYNLPWESMDTPNRRIVNSMLRQSLKPITIKALDMLDVGCTTMITIFKNSFSYFIMLRTVANKD
uniref:Odorant receptor n=1 Tax=Leucinodes orbonalis TaxID=711050 RepID=A0AAU0QP32_9NEOP|nr:odorant receptor [Leucinodes orbonalis]